MYFADGGGEFVGRYVFEEVAHGSGFDGFEDVVVVVEGGEDDDAGSGVGGGDGGGGPGLRFCAAFGCP